MQFFGKWSVVYGLQPNEFASLDQKTQKKLLRLIARVSEQSYRRGFQHGQENANDPDYPVVKASVLRFHGPSLDHSPFTDAFDAKGRWIAKSGMTSLSRLEAEYSLSQVGLFKPKIPPF